MALNQGPKASDGCFDRPLVRCVHRVMRNLDLLSLRVGCRVNSQFGAPPAGSSTKSCLVVRGFRWQLTFADDRRYRFADPGA
jgi:hypothetical protein